jgi:hypothetical protein
LSELSNVEHVGHPLAWPICDQEVRRLAPIVGIVGRRAHRPSAHALDSSTIVDDDQRVKAIRAAFVPELSKINAGETLPRQHSSTRRYNGVGWK